MKKIIMAVAAIAMAASMFAVDFSATVQVKGDIASNNGDGTTSLFGVDNTNQKDNDLLEINFNGDKAGAFVRFWTKSFDGKDEGNNPSLNMRQLKLWFQPIDWIKISVGNLGYNELDLYKERLNWWKVPCGASLAEFGSWDGRWMSGAVLHEAYGTAVELTPMDGLWIGMGASTEGIKFVKDQDKPSLGQLGIGAKYSMNVGIPISFGAVFRRTDTFDLVTIGADFGDWGTPYYAMLQAKLRLDSDSAGYSCDHDNLKLAGITIDNYIQYNFGFMTLQATFPITIRGLLDSNDKSDPSYMTARIKASIPVDAMTLYAVIGSDEGFNNGPAASKADTVWRFDDFGGNFNLYANLGVTFNVGVCALDVGFELGFDKFYDDAGKSTSKTAWAIPFVTKVAF